MSNAAPAETQLPTAAPKSKVMPLLLAANSLLLMGVVGILLLKQQVPASSHAAGAAPPAAAAAEGEHGAGPAPQTVGPTVKLADFVVHLRNPEADRYARMAFDLELGSEQDRAVITTYLPQIRDAIIAHLSDLTLEQLRGSEGLGRTKTELTQRLNVVVPGSRIRALYISDFVVQ